MLVLGIDEAGRGPVIGPMVIAGVLLEKKAEKELKNAGVKDSKLLSKKRRKELEKIIKEKATEVKTIIIPAKEIDSLRKKMSLNEIEAMKIGRLISSFSEKPGLIIIDLVDPSELDFLKRLKKYVTFPCRIKAEHKADLKNISVAAASIIAKVKRDELIEKLSKKHGEFGSGYPADEKTINFLKKNRGKEMDFVRYSWATARKILGKKKNQKQKKLYEW